MLERDPIEVKNFIFKIFIFLEIRKNEKSFLITNINNNVF